MVNQVIKKIGYAALLCCLAFATQGCIVRATVPTATVTVGPAPAVVATAYYTPVYHEGYVVYYDNGGLPYVYVSGRPVYISNMHPRYHLYVNHYHAHRPHYHQWYSAHGHRYHAFRAPGYHGRVVVRGGPVPQGRVIVRGGPPGGRVVVRGGTNSRNRRGRGRNQGPGRQAAPPPPPSPPR